MRPDVAEVHGKIPAPHGHGTVLLFGRRGLDGKLGHGNDAAKDIAHAFPGGGKFDAILEIADHNHARNLHVLQFSRHVGQRGHGPVEVHEHGALSAQRGAEVSEVFPERLDHADGKAGTHRDRGFLFVRQRRQDVLLEARVKRGGGFFDESKRLVALGFIDAALGEEHRGRAGEGTVSEGLGGIEGARLIAAKTFEVQAPVPPRSADGGIGVVGPEFIGAGFKLLEIGDERLERERRTSHAGFRDGNERAHEAAEHPAERADHFLTVVAEHEGLFLLPRAGAAGDLRQSEHAVRERRQFQMAVVLAERNHEIVAHPAPRGFERLRLHLLDGLLRLVGVAHHFGKFAHFRGGRICGHVELRDLEGERLELMLAVQFVIPALHRRVRRDGTERLLEHRIELLPDRTRFDRGDDRREVGFEQIGNHLATDLRRKFLKRILRRGRRRSGALGNLLHAFLRAGHNHRLHHRHHRFDDLAGVVSEAVAECEDRLFPCDLAQQPGDLLELRIAFQLRAHPPESELRIGFDPLEKVAPIEAVPKFRETVERSEALSVFRQLSGKAPRRGGDFD